MDQQPALPHGDYVSSTLIRVHPDEVFPNMVVGDKSVSEWPFLRREISHNWYVDRRAPSVGFVSRDEAAIVHNTALQFDGLPCLEIGCWRGWSTAHMALATHSVDVVDPVLADPAFRGELEDTLRRLGLADRVTLHASASPGGVEQIAAAVGKRWSLAFIDGDHAGDAPLRDAEAVQRFATDDALILLHDLASPEPAAALAYLRGLGWTTAIYQTMQIMGVAWRGRCRPVAHLPDPAQSWTLPPHLTSFAIIGEGRAASLNRVSAILEAPPGRGKIGRSARLDAEACEQLAMADVLEGASEAAERLRTAEAESRRLTHEAEVARHFDDLHRRYVQLVETLFAERGLQATLTAEREAARASLAAALAESAQTAAESTRLRDEKTRLSLLLERSARSLAALGRGDNPTRASWLPAQESGRLRLESERLSATLTHARQAADWFKVRYLTGRAIDEFAASICRTRVLLGLTRRSLIGRADETKLLIQQAYQAHGAVLPLPTGSLEWLHRPRTLLGLLRRRLMTGVSSAEGTLSGALRRHLAAEDTERSPAGTPGEEPLPALDGRLDALSRGLREEVSLRESAERKLKALEQALVSEERALCEAQVELAKFRAATGQRSATEQPEAPRGSIQGRA